MYVLYVHTGLYEMVLNASNAPVGTPEGLDLETIDIIRTPNTVHRSTYNQSTHTKNLAN